MTTSNIKICILLLLTQLNILVLVAEPIWPHRSLNSSIDNFITDDKSGSIYVVSGAYILKYSHDLEILSSNKIDRTTYLSNKILHILRIDRQEFLLSCWQAENLKCMLSKTDDLNLITHLSFTGTSFVEGTGYKVEPNDRIKVLTKQNVGREILVASRRLAPVEAANSTLPAVTLFKFVQDDKSHNITLEQNSVLTYRTRFEERNLFYEYIYLFSYSDYTYFILNDVWGSQNGVRLARVCNNDTALTSYAEISITCNSNSDIVAKYAYLDASNFLYIVFDGADSKPLRRTTYLCSYSMSLANDLMEQAVTKCNDGRSTLLTKLNRGSENTSCQKNPSNDLCTSKINPYIDGTSEPALNFFEETFVQLEGMMSVNFLFPLKQGNDKVILFVGTESGLLTKLSLEAVGVELFYTVDLLNAAIINYHKVSEKYSPRSNSNTTIVPTRHSASLRSIVSITPDGRLHRLDMDACYYYTSCNSCLKVPDPLKCVWCGDSCSREQECDQSKLSNLSCPPVISKIMPEFGPTTGSTVLRIEGTNLGLANGSRIVKLNDKICKIDVALSDDSLIRCTTPAVNDTQNVTLTLEVDDDSIVPRSKGSVSVKDAFGYLECKVYGLNPAEGPKLGESVIKIFGENLNIGENRTILIGNASCEIKDSKREVISCVISNSSPNPPEKQLLHFFIDGVEQMLTPKMKYNNLILSSTYSPKYDPVIEKTDNQVDGEEVIDGKGNNQSRLPTLIFTLLAFALIISAVIYFSLGNLLSMKEKMWPTRKLKENIDLNVSYRSPQPTSINELVKLNGSNYFIKNDPPGIEQPLMNNFLDNDLLSLLRQEKILIDRKQLTLGHVLGSGQFGRVYKGFLKVDGTGEHIAVAVKTIHNKSSWDDALDDRAFVEEGLLMKDFEHENVLTLIGVTVDSSGLPMVITPFMLYGDLRSYISDEASSPTVRELIDFGTQVAKGMAYLSNMKFVHRDLAARNCMLDENLTVKVADFGLSRDIYERDYYSSENKKTKLPVKWMAIESLERCVYSTKSDVWSYGVLLWELMTRGVVPYPDVDNFDLFNYLKEGRRMMRPRYCPEILYKIMYSCWQENPNDRPTFDELVDKVSAVITNLQLAKDGQQTVSRDETYCDAFRRPM